MGIKGDKIAEIGKIPKGRGKKIIDASKKVVSPGFIDIHTHSDRRILEDPTAQNYITQGVTTVIGGNCGGSKLKLRDFFKEIESKKIALNFGTLVGHNTIRKKVMGNHNREPTIEELEEMKRIIEQEMKAGALGLSTGLKYIPGAYSKTREVIELAKVAGKYGGFYASHIREEGLGLIDAVKEAIEIGEKANIAVQLSHHKVVSVDRWGDSKITLELIENAREVGIDVKVDQYPYPATSTGLSVLFPYWSLEGSKEEIKKRLEDPETRKTIKEKIIYNIIHDRGGKDLSNIRIAGYSKDNGLEGKNLKEILEMKGITPDMERAAELILELYSDGNPSAIYRCLSDEDIERIMKYPITMHASDGSIIEMGNGVPHPRNYGTFPRVLSLYVREKGLITLEDAIRKMTSLPASRIGIKDSGIISKGKRTDIVIFDPISIKDRATWDDPHQYPEGISYVFVNGKIVVENGKITGELPGKIIYGPGKEK
ncbi:MAG: D-aminoacylase [Candidatus Helarchaeota archaeon]|nr:D-aminoacylase [Candidatus Helarchaeota archaeon]